MTRDEARAVAQEYATLGGNRQTRTLAKALRILLESEEKAERERDEALAEAQWQKERNENNVRAYFEELEKRTAELLKAREQGVV